MICGRNVYGTWILQFFWETHQKKECVCVCGCECISVCARVPVYVSCLPDVAVLIIYSMLVLLVAS